MSRVRRFVPGAVAALAVVAAVLPALPALAHGEGEPAPDLKGTYMRWWDRAAEQVESLAGAMPADKYGWRPGEGVRSVSEVYMHVAAANYGLSRALGAEIPEGIDPRNLESTVTDKAAVTAMLDKSIAHARAALEATAMDQLGAEVEIFGTTMTKGDVTMILLGHLQEHLGQSIAYARMNGVVPPWSQPAPAAEGEGGEAGDEADGDESASDSAAATDGRSVPPGQPSGRWAGEPISLSVRNADLVETIRSIARIGEVNLVVHPGVGGKVTAELRDVPWDQALDVILRTHGLAAEGSGNTWLVARR